MTQENVKGPVLVSYGVANDIMVRSLETKKARKFARKGWNGKRLYVQVHGAIPTNHVALPDGSNPVIEPFFIIVNEETCKVNTWVASVSDSQALDWYEVF